jgi:FkbM family methyltransferase
VRRIQARRALKQRLRARGWEIARWPAGDPGFKRQLLIAKLGVDLVLDVGANAGHYGSQLRDLGYEGAILSFEPLPAAYAALVKQADLDSRWSALPIALGATPGVLDLNVSRNSVSSSFLPIGERHLAAAPESDFVGRHEVAISTLDTVAIDDVKGAAQCLLKVDTQGYELEVLRGGTEVLQQVAVVEVEMSLTKLYEGQPLMSDIVAFLSNRGFRLYGLDAGFWDRDTGETLQVDGVFVRAEPVQQA